MLNELFDAIFGVDFKVGRTLRDTLLRPVRVAEADINPEDQTYTPQIRIFVALFGLQLFILSVFKLFEQTSLETIFPDPGDAERVAARIAEQGSSVEAANEAIRDWYNYSLWPATILGSVIYIAVMKLLRPGVKLWDHVRIYLVATNAALIWMFPGIALLAWAGGSDGAAGAAALIATALGLVAFYIYLVPLFARWYATTALGLTLKIGLLAVLAVPSFLVTMIVAFFMISFGLRLETGVGLFEATLIAAEIEPAAPPSAEP